MNSYQALQKFQDGGPVGYDFNGGEFGYRLSVPISGLDEFDETKLLRDNQTEYDRFAYSVAEWQDKMERQLDGTPGLAQDNLRQVGRLAPMDGRCLRRCFRVEKKKFADPLDNPEKRVKTQLSTLLGWPSKQVRGLFLFPQTEKGALPLQVERLLCAPQVP